MKLAVYFGLDTTPFVINWEKALLDFHHYIRFDDCYWDWFMHTDDPTRVNINPVPGVTHYLCYSKCSENEIPLDMFGMRFPVVDFRKTFNFPVVNKTCECGAEKAHGKNTGHATWCPKWSKY